MGASWAVFLDRDGVITEPVLDPVSRRYESPYRPDEVALVPGATDALRLLRTLGVPLVVVSNQPAAAKRTARLEDLEGVHLAVERLLAAAGTPVDAYRYCFHHPEGSDAELGRPCYCRKPAPGLILAAAEELGDLDLARSWMIGDSDVDVQAGRNAGCRTVVIEEPRSAHRRFGSVEADAIAATVVDAAIIVCARDRDREVSER
jgi:D-glycero-D-manno-heptose 1,7-bisphosphate phosphatase